MEENQGKIRLIIKNYPYKYRDYSHIAAEAFLAAMDQGRGWEMHDMLLSRSPKLDRKNLLSYGRELQLDMEKFTTALDTMKHGDAIEADKKLAVDMDLYNTPTFFINGRKVIGRRSYEYMKKIFDEELHRATNN
jgi:protein-disulfide isomerase